MKKISIKIPPGLIQGLKKVFKIFLISGVSVFALLFLAIFAALLLFPPSKYKNQVEAGLKAATQSQVVKIGTLATNISPGNFSLGVVATQIEIQGGNGIRTVQIPKAQIHVKPLKIFLGKVPLDMQVMSPHIVLEDFGKSKETQKAQGESEEGSESIEKYSRYFNLSFSVKDAHIDMEPLLSIENNKARSVVKLEKSKLTGHISGSNGKFEMQFDSELNIDLEQGKMLLQGPARIDFSGQIKMEKGLPKDIEIEKLDLDLDHTNIGGMGWLEKTQKSPFKIGFKGHVQLPQSKRALSYRFTQNYIDYGPVQLAFSFSSTENKSFFFKWNVPKTELAGIQIPISSFKDVNVKGSFEFSGDYKSHPSGDRIAAWRFSLNNILLPSKSIAGLNPKNSSGEILLSAISQGTYNNGLVHVPATEIQIDANSAQIEDKNIGLMKPAGDKAQFLLKAVVEENTLEIKKMVFDLHTLKIIGEAQLSNFSDFLKGEASAAELQIASNRVDLSNWGSYFPAFRRQPTLEGTFEVKARGNGKIKHTQTDWKDFSWIVDRLNLTNIQGKLDRSSWAATTAEPTWMFLGPFRANFFFKGRGRGSDIDRAEVLSNLNLDSARVLYSDNFEKRENIPLSFDLFLDQSKQKFQIRQGHLKFHDLDLNFRGNLIQGSRSNSINLVMNRPIDLSNWNTFIRKKSNNPLKGLVQWKGQLTFPTEENIASTNFDWRKFRVDGQLDLNSIQFKSVEMKEAVSDLNAKILLGKKSVTIPKAQMSYGSSKIALSGEIENLSANRGNTLWQWINNKAWKIESQVQIDQFQMEDQKSSSQKKELPLKEIKETFESPLLRESQASLALRLGKGQFSQIPFSDLNAKISWDQGLLRLQPFGMNTLDGKITGSAVFNLKDYYNRKDEPTLSATLKTQNLNIQKLNSYVKPEFSKLMAGSLNGEMMLTSRGFLPADLLNQSKGRVTGEILNGYFDSLKVLQDSFKNLSHDEKIAAFLSDKISQSRCIDSYFTADVDAQINGGNLDVQSGNLKFKSQTDLLLQGSLSKDLVLDMKGEIFPSESCLKPETLRCLKNQDGKTSFPYTLKGHASEAKAQIVYADLGRRIASCSTQKLQAKATEKVKEKSKEVEQKAKEQVKKLFRGF